MIDLTKTLTTLLCSPAYALTVQDPRANQVLTLDKLRCTTRPAADSPQRVVATSGRGTFYHSHQSPDCWLFAQRVLLTVCGVGVQPVCGWVMVTKEELTANGKKVACEFRWEEDE